MTTISDSPGAFFEFSTFGLSDKDLRSLAALDHIWRQAIEATAGNHPGQPLSADFLALTADLPISLARIDWQTEWLHAWHKLHGRGTSLAGMFSFFFKASAHCEQALFASAPNPQKIHIELLGLLRRSIVVAVTCAMELGEQARTAENSLQGELMALRCMSELSEADLPLAVLSLTLDNRSPVDHLSTSDLESLPGILAESLKAMLRPQDRLFAGRGNEWLLLLPGLQSMAQPVLAGEQIQRIFAQPVSLLSGRTMMFKVRIGAAMMPEHAGAAGDLLQAARLARWSNVAGKQGFTWYHSTMNRDWQARYDMLEELQEALDHDDLMLYLQPQINLTGNACVGAELLLRWQRKNGDWVPPPLIIALLEENGWRALFTHWLIRQAMRISSDLEAAGIAISLSLNLTAADMLDNDVPEMLAQSLALWGFSGNRFTLELTESVMMVDRDHCLSVMHQLTGMGFRLALDDFGTGYSSLSYLANLPIREIKIDRSFIVTMFNSMENLRIVSTIVDLAQDLGMVPLAEGVEDALQQEQLRVLGCTMIQGYLHAQPMSMEAFIAWHQARQT